MMHRSGFECVQVVGLTWTFFNAEGSVGVLRPGIVLQLEGGGVVDKWLGALGHACPAVIKVGTGLQTNREIWIFYLYLRVISTK